MEVLRIWHDYRIYLYIGLSVALIAFRIRSRTKDYMHERLGNKCSVEKVISPDQSLRSALPQEQESIRTTQVYISRYNTKSEDIQQTRNSPKRISGSRVSRKALPNLSSKEPFLIQPIVIFYSLSGTTQKFAGELSDKLVVDGQNDTRLLKPYVLDLSVIEYDDYFCSLPQKNIYGKDFEESVRFFYILLIPTYNVDTILDSFLERLREIHYDFRIDTAPLNQMLGYSVLGFGDKREWPTQELGFCTQAQEIDRWLHNLTAGKRAYSLGKIDISDEQSTQEIILWRQGLENILAQLILKGSLMRNVATYDTDMESDSDEIESNKMKASKVLSKKRRKIIVEDLEDLRFNNLNMIDSYASVGTVDFTHYRKSSVQTIEASPKEMVPKSSPTYAALIKQGYHIVGSHSASKTCRWTKSALRGRGSCYKYSFYGIKSHLCMEATPSLSCSNKCVFCWRHGTNPVGTTWRWQVDPPDLVFSGIKEGHYRKIKEMKGIPGVRAERLEEALTIRHCALSLVGEPIFYPHINELVSMLHREQISTFLVCNAQHPDQLQALQKVTQLYVSIDASNKESLRKIDRPLHRDFWGRFTRCLDILREKRFYQRTVFRLTLVKGFNVTNEAEGYADLVARGLPCFIEVKGVTYCGTSTSASAGLTMQNVPFYEEVIEFVESLNAALTSKGLAYDVAAEHAHSCCILIASRRFLVDQVWHTSIDYDRFFECLEKGSDFAPEDYMAPTPQFALYGNGGFNPEDQRVFRKRKPS